MKKIIALLVAIFICFAFNFTAKAHDLAEDGTAFMLVHIDPGEVAVAEKPVTLHINIKNSEHGFDIRKCNCVFTINQVLGEEEKEIFTTSLIPLKNPGEFNVKEISFTFPKDGKYHLNLSAEPISPNLFTSFEVEVQEKVLPVGTILPVDINDNMTNVSTSHTHAYPKVVLAGAIIFTLVMGYFLFSKNKSLAKRIVRK